MSITTSQQIARYYEQFNAIDVTFTKEVIKATLLYPKQVYLKCLGYQWSCIVYSTSMIGARVLVNLHSTLNETVRKANNLVSLRFSFLQRDKADPLTFFVASKITGFTPYGPKKPDFSFVSLQYTQRPPDGLIEILGELLEANVNSQKRSEDRIAVTADSMRKIGLTSKEATVLIQGVPRRCILRDLSFSGAKVVIFGIAQFIVNRDAVLRLELEEPANILEIEGKIVRFEPVEGRSDIAAFAIQFTETAVPMDYKLRVNTYLKTFRVKPAEETSHE
ncbi:MAG TPA: PilZ domain-containing protein [Spirochaetia bacterium]|nr:PilZ domain-containing protein [Spirochaetia bacterium]